MASAPAAVGKAFKNFYVLIHFFQEQTYSVEKLKNVLTHSCSSVFQVNDFRSWTGWNSSDVVDVLWKDNNVYPAYFLQFGENKKEMDDLVDELLTGKVSKSEVPLLQVSRPFATSRRLKSKELVKKKNDGSFAKIVTQTSLKEKQKQKTSIAQNKILQDVKKKIATKPPCVSCNNLQQQVDVANEEIRQLKVKVAHYKEKASRYKRKSKDARLNAAEEVIAQPSLAEMCKLGENTMILKSKLSMCRTTDFSKYVGDLLDVLFTTETLGKSVIKGIKGAKKSDVLDINIVNDVQQHVAEKFNVSVQNVRAAIRQKLNVAHKIMQNKEN